MSSAHWKHEFQVNSTKIDFKYCSSTCLQIIIIITIKMVRFLLNCVFNKVNCSFKRGKNIDRLRKKKITNCVFHQLKL